MARSSSPNTLKITFRGLPVSRFQARTVFTAISAASLLGKPKTPVEVQQTAMLPQSFSAAVSRQAR